MNVEALLECRAMRESKEREARSGFALLGRGKRLFSFSFCRRCSWFLLVLCFYRLLSDCFLANLRKRLDDDTGSWR
jgi:hypothetical protein